MSAEFPAQAELDSRYIEQRVRRRAARLDLLLRKSRSRTPEHPPYGHYWLVDPRRNSLVAGDEWGWPLEDISDHLDCLEGFSTASDDHRHPQETGKAVAHV